MQLRPLAAFALLALAALISALPLAAQGTAQHYAHLPLVIGPVDGATVSPTATPPPTATPTATPPPTASPDPGDARREVIRLLAEERARAGCAVPLVEHPALMAGAQAWSEEQRATGVGGHSPLGWYADHGYNDYGVGENIGFNPTPATVIEAWLNSPAHRDTMMECVLGASYYDVGVGYSFTIDGLGHYWTLAIRGW